MKHIKYILTVVLALYMAKLSAQDSLFIFVNETVHAKFSEAEIDSIKFSHSALPEDKNPLPGDQKVPDRFTIYHNSELSNSFYTTVTDSLVFNWQKKPLTLDDLLNKLEDAYHLLYFDSYADHNYNSLFLMSDLRADDIFKGGGDVGDQNQLYGLSQLELSKENGPKGLWTIYYEGINRCNDLLSSLDHVSGAEPSVIETVRSEALFLRAYYLHWLWKFWGNIYFTENTFKDPFIQTLYNADEIYDIIMQDIDAVKAAENLPMRSVQPETRATLAAVYMLKARVVMYQKDETRYSEVLQEMNAIINSEAFALMSYFAEIWPREGEFCAESIFEVDHRSQPGKSWGDGWVGYGTNFPAFISPNGLDYDAIDLLSGTDVYKGGWGFAPVRPTTLGIFEEGDERRDASINQFEVGTYYARFQDTGLFMAKYAARKGYNEPPGDVDLNYENNLRIFRLAETYLNIAELIVLHGVAPEGSIPAQDALDAIRTRAGIAPTAATADNIKLERRREFLGEGMRFWDLVRWGDANLLTENLPQWHSSRIWDESKKYLDHPHVPNRIAYPTVELLKITNIANNSADVYYQIVSEGKSPLTDHGCYLLIERADERQYIEPISNEDSGNIHKVQIPLSGGLLTSIYVYGTNSFGTSSSRQFLEIPSKVSTDENLSVSYFSATGSGILQENDEIEYISRGLLASKTSRDFYFKEENSEFVIADIGPGIGSFECDLSGLESSTGYYIRAYVVNEHGVDYGEVIWIRTSSRISTASPSVSLNSVISGGIVEEGDQTEFTARGLIVSKQNNPVLDNDDAIVITDLGQGSGNFESEISELESNTYYYVRAYAVGEEGVHYGNARQIRTPINLEAFLNTTASTNYKKWVINYTIEGHVGVGHSGGDGNEWWRIPAGKYQYYLDNGFYDDIITFNADGTFEYDPGPDGNVLVSSYVTIEPYSNHANGDYNYPAPIDELIVSSYVYNGFGIDFPEGTVVTMIPNDDALLTPNYRIHSLTESELILIIDNGIEAYRFVFAPLGSIP